MELEIRPSWRDQLGLLLLSVLLALATIASLVVGTADVPAGVVTATLAAMTVLAILVLLYRRYVWRFQVSDGAIESHYGIISRNVHSIRIRDLRNINVRQSILQRLLGIGDVEFSSAGGAGIEVTFFGVAEPMALKTRIQAIEAAPEG